MKSKFGKFKYQLVESTHKSFQEVLVSFEYKEKPCHYYAFIKERAKTSKAQYIKEAKEEIDNLMASGELEKRAKQYLNYSVGKQEVNKVKVAGSKTHKSIPAHLPFACLCILGVLALIGGVVTFLRRMGIVQWPEYMLTEAEKFSAMVHLYVAIALGVIGIVLLAVGIPLLIKKLKK